MSAPGPHSARYHCELGPSSAKRWIECPGSIKAARKLGPQKSSVFADEGTAAHELANHCLEQGWDAARFLGWVIDIHAPNAGSMFIQRKDQDPNPDEGLFAVDEEMVDGVQMYLDECRRVKEYVEAQNGEVLFEERVYVSEDPEINGTCDFGAYDPARKRVVVVDFKYGRGIAVHPKENPQAMLYALGLVNRMDNRGVREVEITIVQPRGAHDDGAIRTWTCSPVDLLDFEAEAIEAGKLAQGDDAPFKAGEWCREGFCPLRANCKFHDDWALDKARAQFDDNSGALILPDPFEMTPEQIAERLEWVEHIQGWCKVLLAHAHEQAEQGRVVPGWKLVNKRQYRRFQDGAVEMLADSYGLEEDQIYKPREYLSPAQIEPLLPGKNKTIRAEKLKPYLAPPSPTGTVLAREQDKRPAANRSASGQFEDLSGE